MTTHTLISVKAELDKQKDDFGYSLEVMQRDMERLHRTIHKLEHQRESKIISGETSSKFKLQLIRDCEIELKSIKVVTPTKYTAGNAIDFSIILIVSDDNHRRDLTFYCAWDYKYCIFNHDRGNYMELPTYSLHERNEIILAALEKYRDQILTIVCPSSLDKD